MLDLPSEGWRVIDVKACVGLSLRIGRPRLKCGRFFLTCIDFSPARCRAFSLAAQDRAFLTHGKAASARFHKMAVQDRPTPGKLSS